MKVDPIAAGARDAYRLMVELVTPRPIGWVSTLSAAGVDNLAPFSFFNAVGANPPALCFSVSNRRDGSVKDTIRNIEATGDFVVNVASYDLREAVNASALELPYEESEFAHCGLTPAPSVRVRPPRVAESKAQFECVVHQIVRVGEGGLAANLVIGRIVYIHVDDRVLNEVGHVDPAKLDTIGRMGGDGYARTTDLFAMARPMRPVVQEGEKPKTRP
jgi:flavin reductase (DIM6/NTAB) family NADH-FMN oxidoreductase RutF